MGEISIKGVVVGVDQQAKHEKWMRALKVWLSWVALPVVVGCANPMPSADMVGVQPPRLTAATQTHMDIVSLPRAKGKVVAAVYGFRDQTGQYKPSAENSFSTAVTQGATSMLVKALNDSDWFIPVEREGLQNLLTERKIIRAIEPQEGQQTASNVPSLLSASVLLEGGIIAYESNLQTGGVGARYLGIGAHTQYRTDQVTVNLRAVDVRTGRVLNSISVSKTIYSYQIATNIFRFIAFKDLLEMDSGYTKNEPAQLCVQDAIEAAVIYLIAEGVQANNWALLNKNELNSSVLQKYIQNQEAEKRAVENRPVSSTTKTRTPVASNTVVESSSVALLATTLNASVNAKEENARGAAENSSNPVAVSSAVPIVMSPPAVSKSDILEQRMAAGRRLLGERRAVASIQLFVSEEIQLDEMERFLKRADALGTLHEIYVLPVGILNVTNQVNRFGHLRSEMRDGLRVLYGAYASFAEARNAIKVLPASYQKDFAATVVSL